MDAPHLRVAIVGAGFVGRALVEMLHDSDRRIALEDAASATLEIVGVAVRDVSAHRPGVPRELLCDDPIALAARADVDIVVELIGGVDVARRVAETTLGRGASFVTANKALMALCGSELARLAHENQADLMYEASVGGAIPIIRALRTSLAGERISRVIGIVNGTTNFVLSAMTERGVEYHTALEEAQSLGYAESDPRADVEGFDAAAKVQILASLAIGTALDGEEISREGISALRLVDVEFARRAGYVIKALGVVERVGEHGLSRRTHPALVPLAHPLAAVHGAMNAVFVEGDKSGPLMWLGRGAGGEATATAVLGDLLHAARNRVAGRHDLPFTVDDRLYAVDEGDVSSVFYISLDVVDEPGVLAQVAGVFGSHDVSIQSMEQSGFAHEARLSFVTHEALTRDVNATLADLDRLSSVERVGACIRVVDGGSR
jgi:homoserine dehydrogenase